jgi:hypothetical protein
VPRLKESFTVDYLAPIIILERKLLPLIRSKDFVAVILLRATVYVYLNNLVLAGDIGHNQGTAKNLATDELAVVDDLRV